MMTAIDFIHGDCLDIMPLLPDGCVDMVLCDPPYGTTACKWDSVIPLDQMWVQLKRLVKPRGAIVMTAAQPFTSALISSNYGMFKYCWAWDKVLPRNHLNAKKQPLRRMEDVAVFYALQSTYNAIKTEGHERVTVREKYTREGDGRQVYGAENRDTFYSSTERYPTDYLKINAINQGHVHPTQKPVALMEYMIKTYTNPGDTVLDFAAGSGTTGVACKNLGRNFIGIEKKREYVDICRGRV